MRRRAVDMINPGYRVRMSRKSDKPRGFCWGVVVVFNPKVSAPGGFERSPHPGGLNEPQATHSHHESAPDGSPLSAALGFFVISFSCVFCFCLFSALPHAPHLDRNGTPGIAGRHRSRSGLALGRAERDTVTPDV